MKVHGIPFSFAMLKKNAKDEVNATFVPSLVPTVPRVQDFGKSIYSSPKLSLTCDLRVKLIVDCRSRFISRQF